MTDRELMQMALDAMESFEGGTNGLYKGEFAEERKALRDRLAQPEPVHAVNISQERVDETAKCGHEPAPNDYDRSIHNNPDAQAWAKFFMATVKEKEWCIDDIDEGLMFGWFANAMMAMHDHVKREHEFECPRCGHCCRGWVGLTDGEMVDLLKECEGRLWSDGFRAIEAKLKEKNT